MPTAPKPKRRRWVSVLLWLILIVAVAGLGYYIWFLQNQIWYTREMGDPVVAEEATANTNTAAQTAQATVKPIVDPGITWKVNNQALADLKLASSALDQAAPTAVIKYYQVATDDRGGRYVLMTAPVGMGYPAYGLFKQDSAGAWSILSRYSQMDVFSDESGLKLADSVGVVATAIASLDIPDRLTFGSGSIVKGAYTSTYDRFTEVAGSYKYTKLADTEYGVLYSASNVPASGSTATAGESEMIALASNDGRYIAYTLDPAFVRDDKTLNVTPVSGLSLPGKYSLVAAGCGATGRSYILSSSKIEPKIEVAGSNEGKLYAITDPANEAVKEYYEEYKSTRTYQGSTEKVVSESEYIAAYPILVWKDMFGRWVELRNTAFEPLAECGKPVVYLYPKQTTTVTVKVDADVTVSDPDYGQGWTAVAEPSGRLTVAGQSYPYLFWEGFGHGTYPDTSNIGAVVSQANLIPALKSQMTQLGLTTAEQADFLEFWAERLPTTPYVRLTWLTTPEMEQVAKLTIDPKPDTLIRVFLDFEGLQAPRVLRPQRLSAPERRGFVAVEWGGSLSSK